MKLPPLTPSQILNAMKTETPFNQARRAFSSASGRIEQASQQRQPASPIQIREMEFQAVLDIALALGLDPQPLLEQIQAAT